MSSSTAFSIAGAEEDSPLSAIINQVSFSRDRQLILLCTTHGLSVISTSSFRKVAYIATHPNAVLSADIVTGSGLAGVVIGVSSFQLWNCATRSPVSPIMSIDRPIIGLRLNEKRVLILTATNLLIFDLKRLALILAVERGEGIPSVSLPLISANDTGLCAFPTATGIQVVDTYTLSRYQPIRAHDSPVTAIEMNDRILVTASTKGTIIRIFKLPSMELVGLFRRGRTESPIKSLLISADSSVLSVAGDSDTAHLFRLSDVPGIDTAGVVTGGGSPPWNAYQSMLNFFPQHYKDAMEAVRDFAVIRLRRETSFKYITCVIALGGSKKSADVAVVSEETGFVFVYEANLAKGGECRLKAEYALLSVDGDAEFVVTAAGSSSSVPESPLASVKLTTIHSQPVPKPAPAHTVNANAVSLKSSPHASPATSVKASPPASPTASPPVSIGPSATSQRSHSPLARSPVEAPKLVVKRVEEAIPLEAASPVDVLSPEIIPSRPVTVSPPPVITTPAPIVHDVPVRAPVVLPSSSVVPHPSPPARTESVGTYSPVASSVGNGHSSVFDDGTPRIGDPDFANAILGDRPKSKRKKKKKAAAVEEIFDPSE